jgi:hypothetical protein
VRQRDSEITRHNLGGGIISQRLCARAAKIVWFFREHRGQPLPSAALMQPMSRSFVAALEGFAAQRQVPLVQFHKGQRKDEVMADRLRHFPHDEGVVFIGKAQEKTSVFRTEKRRNPKTGAPYPWIVRSTAMVNHYYIYAVDRDFGPFFLKFCSYFPFNAKLCLNGHEYAKCQLAQRRIDFQALTMESSVVPIPSASSRFATASPETRSMPSCASGCASSHIHLPGRIDTPVIVTTSRSCKPSPP